MGLLNDNFKGQLDRLIAKNFPYIIFGLMAVFAMRDLGGYAINPLMITALTSIIAIILPYSTLLSYAAFMLPLSCGIQSITWVVILGCLLFKSEKIPVTAIIVYAIIAILELIGLIQFESNAIIFKNVVFYLVSLFVIMYLVNDNNSGVDAKANSRYFIYGTAFLFVMIYGRLMMEESVVDIMEGMLRYDMEDIEKSGDYVFFTNANNIGLYSSVCFAALVMGNKRLNMPIWSYVISIVIIAAGGMLSFSRTWLLLAALTLVFFVLFSSKNMGYVLFTVVIMVSIFLLINSEFFDSIYETFETRLTDDDVEDGAGRTDLFRSYNEFFSLNPKYWLTGTGAVYYGQICQQPLSIHNSIQQLYICYGAVGFVTFLVFFVNIFRNNKKYIRHIIQYLPIVIYLIFAQTLQIVNPIYCMYPLVLAVYCLQIYKHSSYEL